MELNPKRRCKCSVHTGNEQWHGKYAAGRQYHGCICKLCKRALADRMVHDYHNAPGRKEKVSKRQKAKYIPKPPRIHKPTLAERRKALWEKQAGICALCHKPLELENACLDHDHSCCDIKTSVSCGKCDRAVLHNACNSMIGFANDNPDLLLLGADYVLGFGDMLGEVAYGSLATVRTETAR